MVNQQDSVHELSSLPLQLGSSQEFCWLGILPVRPLSLLGSWGFPKLRVGRGDEKRAARRFLSTGLPRGTLKPRVPGKGAGWGRKFLLAPRPRPLALPVPSPPGCSDRSDADLVTLTSAGRGDAGGCELGAPGRAMGQGELGRGRGGRGTTAFRRALARGFLASRAGEERSSGRNARSLDGPGSLKRAAAWENGGRCGPQLLRKSLHGIQLVRSGPLEPKHCGRGERPAPGPLLLLLLRSPGPPRAAPSPPTGCGLRPGRGPVAVVAAPSGRDRPAGGSALGRRGRPRLPWVEAGSWPARSRPDPPASPTPAVTRRLRARARAAASSAMDRSVPDPVPRSAPRTPAPQPANSAG